MSSCIKELYGYNLVEKCLKCGNILKNSIFIEIKVKMMDLIHNANSVEKNIM